MRQRLFDAARLLVGSRNHMAIDCPSARHEGPNTMAQLVLFNGDRMPASTVVPGLTSANAATSIQHGYEALGDKSSTRTYWRTPGPKSATRGNVTVLANSRATVSRTGSAAPSM